MWCYELIFLFTVVLVAGSGLLAISRKNPLKSVLYLLINIISTGILFGLLNSQFVAIIQILLYGGAVVVLFLFIVMFSNLREGEHGKERQKNYIVLCIITCAIIFIGIAISFFRIGFESFSVASSFSVKDVGRALFTDLILVVQLVALMILSTIVCVFVILGKSSNDKP